MPDLSRRQTLQLIASAALTTSLTGCGTILYPERRGQPKGQLDWGVVALDGLGLLLFFIPGVVAFAVDFATGAIYLPPEYCGQTESTNPDELKVIHTKPSRENIERTIKEQTGSEITLTDERITTRPLKKLRDFWPTLKRLS